MKFTNHWQYIPLSIFYELGECLLAISALGNQGVGKSRFMVVHMEKDTQVMTITVAFLY